MGKNQVVTPERGTSLNTEETAAAPSDMEGVVDRIIKRYGRSGSGRASALRLIGAYLIFETEGAAGLRRRGFSRNSIQLYREKLMDADVKVR